MNRCTLLKLRTKIPPKRFIFIKISSKKDTPVHGGPEYKSPRRFWGRLRMLPVVALQGLHVLEIRDTRRLGAYGVNLFYEEVPMCSPP